MVKPIFLGIIAILITSIGAFTTINMRQGTSQAELLAQTEKIIESNNAQWAKVNITDNEVFISGKTLDDSTLKSLIKELSQIKGVNSVTSTVEVSRPLTQEQCQQAVDSILETGLVFSDKNAITSNSRPLLKSLANTIRLCPDHSLVVVSHTANNNSVENNQKISKLRSANIRTYLKQELGVTQRSIAAIGMGAAFPIALNDSEANRSLNDRIEIIIK